MTILTSQAQIAEASLADLLETYNALTGQSVKRFATREVGARRTENAMLAAKDADGHTGVPKGAAPQVRTREEIVAKAAAKGVPTPPALGEEPPVTFPEGTLGAKLSATAETAKPIEPRARKAQPEAKTRQSIYAVAATFSGTSKPQLGSVRNNVLTRIQTAQNAAGEVIAAATVEALDKHFAQSTRGYIQKLIEKDHLRVLTAEEFAQTQPVGKVK